MKLSIELDDNDVNNGSIAVVLIVFIIAITFAHKNCTLAQTYKDLNQPVKEEGK